MKQELIQQLNELKNYFYTHEEVENAATKIVGNCGFAWDYFDPDDNLYYSALIALVDNDNSVYTIVSIKKGVRTIPAGTPNL